MPRNQSYYSRYYAVPDTNVLSLALTLGVVALALALALEVVALLTSLVQGHSRSPILVPIDSPNLLRPISRSVSELLRQIVNDNDESRTVNAMAASSTRSDQKKQSFYLSISRHSGTGYCVCILVTLL